MLYATYVGNNRGGSGGGGGVPVYPNFAAFPVLAINGSLAVDGSTGIVYEFFGGSWIPVASNAAYTAALSGTGTVTSVSVVSNNGFAGTVANPTTTPAITLSTTITGILKGNGTAISAAIPGTDYQLPLTFGNLTDAGTDGITVTGGTGAVIGSGTSLSQRVADATHNGYLASTDWNTFNNKQSLLIPGNISTSTTGVTVGSGTASTVGPNVTVDVQTASGSQPGLLSAADWTTFNSKQPAGSYITALVGQILASGPGSATATIATNTVSNSNLAQAPANTIKGNNTGSAANELDLTVSQVNTMLGDILANGTVAFTASQSLGGFNITNSADPTTAQMLATKNYVDMSVAALQPLSSVYAATAGSNISGTYLNGVAGVGATFVTTATGVFTVDGVTPPLNSRILIKDQSSGFQNGVYYISTLGSLGISTTFTRTLDYDTASDMNAAGLIPVINGTVNALSSWQQVATITTVGTDALVFTEFTANPSLYLLKSNNLSDVANANTSFSNISPLTTKGDVLSFSTVNARLAVGSNGQVLTADSTQTLGIKWATPTTGTVTSVALTVPTFLSVSGSPITSSGTLAVTLSGTALPIANGGTGQTTAAAAFNSLNPMTTTGDIIYESGTNTAARLPIGTAAQVLTVVAGVPAWRASSAVGANSQVFVNGGNGYGSTNTLIRRFTNTQANTGVDITYVDSPTLGGTFTINTTGLYTVIYADSDSLTGAPYYAITVNDSALSTGISQTQITYTQGLRAVTRASGTNQPVPCSWTGLLNVNDVVRAHTDGQPTNTSVNFIYFSVTRIQ